MTEDALIERLKLELAQLEAQQEAVLDATRRAFPLGSTVLSFARSERGTVCTVEAHCGEFLRSDVGYLVLRNNVSGKRHKAPAVSPFTRVELLERPQP